MHMQPDLTDAQKMRHLPWLLAFQLFGAFAVNLCIFGSVVALFFDALGMDKSQIGFLFALLPILGILAPFISSFATRVGAKRITILFLGGRMFIVALFLLLPAVQGRFGQTGVFILVAFVMASFGFFRVIGENGFIGWMQEAVPKRIRGKYTSIEFLAAMGGIFGATLLAGLFLEDNANLSQYLWLIGGGVVLGLLATLLFVPVPGGAPVVKAPEHRVSFRSVVSTLRDANFRHLSFGVGLGIFGTASTLTFLPLFLTEQAGFTPSSALLTQNAMLIGMVVFSYFWGWASDRYGSKPVLVSGMLLLSVLLLSWVTLPYHHYLSRVIATGLFFLIGLANVAYNVGASRQLYLIMPPDRKEHYIPAYYVAYNVCNGLALLLGGLALDGFKYLSQQFPQLNLDPYMPLFVISAVCCLASACVFQRMNVHGEMETRRFAGLFMQGNPLTAMGLLVRHRWINEEHERVSFVEKLGDVKSPLTVEELIEALHDPSFHVRYEAINSIARTPARPELVEALTHVLYKGETELRASAIWALSRLGDPQALPALRDMLRSEYPLLRSRAARALGMMNDTESIDTLRLGMRDDHNPDLKVAYAAALGALHDRESAEEICALLDVAQSDVYRAELSLALARLLGGSQRFSLLWRKVRGDVPAGVSAALLDLTKPIAKWVDNDPSVAEIIEHASRSLAHEGLDAGGKALAELIAHLPLQNTFVAQAILTHCAAQLRNATKTRPEYVILILHALQEQTRM